MPSHLRLTPILVAALVGSAGGAAAETPAIAQIYQQRGADGSIVLTDRPSPKAVTERTWQIDREDPVAARQRALEVKREADAVSERVQRSIESQQRLALETDLLRLRLALLERQSEAAASDADNNAVAIVGVGFRPFANRRPPPHRPMRMPMRRGPINGPTGLGSR